MRVLVSGAAGFLGRRLVPFLESNGYEVYALSRSEKIGRHPLVMADVNADSLRAALEGIDLDAVVNLAAAGVRPGERGIELLTRVNSVLPCELLAAASRRGARMFLQTGTCAEYAASQLGVLLSEESPIAYDKAYGATKAAASMLLPLWGREYAVRVVTLRLFNVFGPGEAAHRLLPSLIRSLRVGETVPLSIGTQLRDFLHVDDVCRAMFAMLRAMDADQRINGVFNLASGTPMSVAEFARRVAAAVGVSEALLLFGSLSLRPDDLPCVVGDSSKLQAACGWSPPADIGKAIDDAVKEMLCAH
ncbi:NAD(P)-dependent oxidoreductase [Niveibacterium sp. COAC-50]|uniref:NAD-dependent epimerase/dehydratase family protein n=1 Tax=Niveibacterium sp. COAC-50 TaxID=2729384 RepID=UPI0015568BAA|nr:NAD-dependent epimerase/dehydratase [Niveibacterium sp. COAC-50]